MPTLLLVRDRSAPITLRAEDAAALVDVLDEAGAPVPFSCRSASCGTCRVVVLAGEDELEPPADEELDVLDAFGDAPPRMRLACCARLRPGAATVELRPARDDD